MKALFVRLANKTKCSEKICPRNFLLCGQSTMQLKQTRILNLQTVSYVNSLLLNSWKLNNKSNVSYGARKFAVVFLLMIPRYFTSSGKENSEVLWITAR